MIPIIPQNNMEHKGVSSYKFLGADILIGMTSSTTSIIVQGFCQILVGYPLDFLKTRLQMAREGGAISHLKAIIKNEGLRTLYRG
jgi:hypothetical protein